MNNSVLLLQKNSSNSILNNNNIIFDETIDSSENITYNDQTGVVTISENGTYIIDWCIATQSTSGSSGVIFKLISSQGHEYDSNSSNRTDNMSGIAVLNVENAPINFSIVNKSNSTVFFQDIIVSKANLRVFLLNSSNVTNNSRCFALNQLANLIEQIVEIYEGDDISVFSNRLATLSGTIHSIYRSPDAENIPLFIVESDGQLMALNINEITLLYLPNSIYNESITYLDLPNPFPQNCDTDLLKDIHDYITVGDTIFITAGPTTSASGDVSVNEYGIIVLADETSTIFLSVPKISILFKQEQSDSVSEKKGSTLSIRSEKT
jgi:hypothetical protein